MPREVLSFAFGGSYFGSIAAMLALATPLYVNQISAAGIAFGLLEKGVSNGAAMAFLIGGPVTAIPAMSALWMMFRKRVFALYLVVSLTGSAMLAELFQQVHGRWPGF